MPNPDIAPLTTEELTAANLQLEGWESDAHHAALVRDMGPNSPYHGKLLWIMRPETVDAQEPVLSNIPAVLTSSVWTLKQDGSYGDVATLVPFTIRCGGLVGWWPSWLTEEQRARLPLHDAVAGLGGLEAATDWRDRIEKHARERQGDARELAPVIVNNPASSLVTTGEQPGVFFGLDIPAMREALAKLKALGADQYSMEGLRTTFALKIGRAALGE